MHCEHKANRDVTKPMYFLIINLYKVILYLCYTYSHMTIHTNNIITKIKIKIKTKTHIVSMRYILIHIYIMRLNSIRTWCKTHILPF